MNFDGSPTPRARAFSSNWWPTSAWSTSWRGCEIISAPTHSATPLSTTCWAPFEQASGRDLSDWGRQWLKTTGLNSLQPEFDIDGDGRFTRFAIRQGGAKPGAGRPGAPTGVGVYDDDDSGKLVRVHREELDVAGDLTDIPALQECHAEN